jgi:hypothetical protein
MRICRQDYRQKDSDRYTHVKDSSVYVLIYTIHSFVLDIVCNTKVYKSMHAKIRYLSRSQKCYRNFLYVR